VRSSTFRTPSGERTPLKAESACDPDFGSTRRLNVATTSSARIVPPFWNLTPRRSLNVQTLASWLGFQLVASSGERVRFGFARFRNSPTMLVASAPPWAASRWGSSAPEGGGMIANRRRPPALTARGFASATGASPSAPMIPPRSGSDRPNIVPRRMNSPRSISPAANSSMSVFSTCPACRR
jgi:hypothetical protein